MINIIIYALKEINLSKGANLNAEVTIFIISNCFSDFSMLIYEDMKKQKMLVGWFRGVKKYNVNKFA